MAHSGHSLGTGRNQSWAPCGCSSVASVILVIIIVSLGALQLGFEQATRASDAKLCVKQDVALIEALDGFFGCGRQPVPSVRFVSSVRVGSNEEHVHHPDHIVRLLLLILAWRHLMSHVDAHYTRVLRQSPPSDRFSNVVLSRQTVGSLPSQSGDIGIFPDHTTSTERPRRARSNPPG